MTFVVFYNILADIFFSLTHLYIALPLELISIFFLFQLLKQKITLLIFDNFFMFFCHNIIHNIDDEDDNDCVRLSVLLENAGSKTD